MVIESGYWREDLVDYIKKFQPVRSPPRWTEKLVVNFEKDVTIALFMVRRLSEAGKFSAKFKNHKVKVSRCLFNGKPHRLIFKDIDELYDLKKEEKIIKDPIFICNQFIHAYYTYAIRSNDRNWAALYTCSDFEKLNWIYKISISEIISILELALHDEPSRITWRYDKKTEKWEMETY